MMKRREIIDCLLYQPVVIFSAIASVGGRPRACQGGTREIVVSRLQPQKSGICNHWTVEPQPYNIISVAIGSRGGSASLRRFMFVRYLFR